MTDGLLALRDWRCTHKVRVVGMESTGADWKPVYSLLEDDLECWLRNAHHLRNVPGRKTDSSDAAWSCQLVEHGLVRPSFVPPRPIRQPERPHPLPQGRYPGTHPRGAAPGEGPRRRGHQAVVGGQRHPPGVSGRAMLAARIRGQLRPRRHGRAGQGAPARQAPRAAGRATRPLRPPSRPAGRRDAHPASTPPTRPSSGSQRRSTGSSPRSTWALTLLETIAGVARRTAEPVVAETGADMGRFPSAAHLASWAGRCPGTGESAGKHHSGKTRKGSKWLRGILVSAYHVLDRRQPYAELGGDDFLERQSNEAHVRRLERLGLQGQHPASRPAA